MSYQRRGLGATAPANLAPVISSAAAKYGISPDLLTAVISQESSFNPNAVSPAGAQGLMQMMPATAAQYGVSNSFDPAQSIDGGAHYLSDLLKQYNGDTTLALAAYNAGPGNVAKYGGVPPFTETINYVKSIVSKLLGTPVGSFQLVLPTHPPAGEPPTPAAT
jgi:soluble lytic murein transglycosylase-like protein